jgi:hypothetical protein
LFACTSLIPATHPEISDACDHLPQLTSTLRAT